MFSKYSNGLTPNIRRIDQLNVSNFDYCFLFSRHDNLILWAVSFDDWTVVADKDLLELYGIFGDQLRAALDIIDRDKITIFRRANDNRQYIEIVQQQNSFFKLLPNINYCMCAEFREKVIGAGELYTCQHVLAAKLSCLLGKTEIKTANDDAFSFSLRMIRPISIAVNPNTITAAGAAINAADIE